MMASTAEDGIAQNALVGKRKGRGAQMADITNQRFGRLIARTPSGRDRHKNVIWDCACDCGNVVRLTAASLRKGHTRSCGCLRADEFHARVRKHGKSSSSVYMVWEQMVARCTNTEHKDFDYYGGRGITVCDEWRSFESFYTDMGDPGDSMMLERRDNNLGYSAANCVWATRVEQANNRSNNVMIVTIAEVMTMAQFARSLCVHYANVRSKVNRGVREINGIKFEVKTRKELSV